MLTLALADTLTLAVGRQLSGHVAECLLLALSGHEPHLTECPLSGVKRTSLAQGCRPSRDPDCRQGFIADPIG